MVKKKFHQFLTRLSLAMPCLILVLFSPQISLGREVGAPSLKFCTVKQGDLVRQLDIKLKARIEKVRSDLVSFKLSYVREHFVIPRGWVWTNGSLANKIYIDYKIQLQKVFDQMFLESHRGINYQCVSARARIESCYKTMAYVNFFGNMPLRTIYLCPLFFTAPEDSSTTAIVNESEQLSTLMHELSHYAAGTEDLVLNWIRADITQAANDAFHIQGFAFGDVETQLKGQIWNRLWSPRIRRLP